MSYLLFGFCIAIGLAYFGFKRRPFDYFSVLFFSGLGYSHVCFYGYIDVKVIGIDFYSEVPPEVYWSLTIFFFIVLLGTILFDHYHPPVAAIQGFGSSLEEKRPWLRRQGRVCWLIGVVAFSLMVWQNPELILFSESKIEVLSAIGRYHSIFVASALLGIGCSFLARDYLTLLLFAPLVFGHVYVGFRLVLVVSFIILVVAFEKQRAPASLVSKWKLLIGGFVFLWLALIIKEVYFCIRAGDLSLLETLLGNAWDDGRLDPVSMLRTSEMGVNMLLFVEAVHVDFTLPWSHFFRSFLVLVPGLGFLGIRVDSDFNYLFQEPVLKISNELTGLAANCFAEWYALGGLGAVTAFSLAVVGAVYMMSRATLRVGWLYPFLATLLAIVAFYIFRNGFHQVFDWTRRLALMSFVVSIIPLLGFGKVSARRSWGETAVPSVSRRSF